MSDGNVASFPQDNNTDNTEASSGASEVGGVSGQRLRSFIERIERLEEEKAAIADDIKEVYAEAKGTGFEPKAMRSLIKLRKMDSDKRQEEEAILETYKAAVGLA